MSETTTSTGKKLTWFLRSMGDRDTHRGTYSIMTRSVHAACGVEFEPLKQRNGAPIELTPAPRRC